MATIGYYLKTLLNRGLAPLNMRLDSLTAERTETEHLNSFVRAGHFDAPIFPVLKQFEACNPSDILNVVKSCEARFQRFKSGADANEFTFDNHFYRSPDAEVLYAIVGLFKPKAIVEIGSGYSTLLFRHAIADNGLSTSLTSIDPSPRREISAHADKVITSRLEDLTDLTILSQLQKNDILFIDSSHEIQLGNDVLKLYLTIIPLLNPGVLIHIHDVFLPYEYPKQWVVECRWKWSEQYLVQAMLQCSNEFDVLWCGHYLQKARPGILKNFKCWSGADARSLWIVKRGAGSSA
jgi:predicted O-methyltransferase YrrM